MSLVFTRRRTASRQETFVNIVILACTLGATTISCIPISVKRVDHIVAVAWTGVSEPIALAERAMLGEIAYAVNPEGPGVYGFGDERALILIKGRQRHVLPINIPGAKTFDVVDAVLRADGDGFLVVLSAFVRGSDVPSHNEYHCLIAQFDGLVSPCIVPQGYLLSGFGLHLVPGGQEVVVRRRDNTGSWFEYLNVDTGEVYSLDSPFPTFFDKPPCSIRHKQLSPKQDTLAFVCWMPGLDVRNTGLWVIDEQGPPTLLYEADDTATGLHRLERHRRLEDMITGPRDEYSLAWSPAQDRLYYCGGRLATGVVVSLGGAAPVLHRPCLLQAAWSADGRRLAGVIDSKLAVCEISSDEREVAALVCVSGKRFGKRPSN